MARLVIELERFIALFGCWENMGEIKEKKKRSLNFSFSTIWDLRKRPVIWNSALIMKTKVVLPHLSGNCLYFGHKELKILTKMHKFVFFEFLVKCLNLYFLNFPFYQGSWFSDYVNETMLTSSPPFSTINPKKGRAGWYLFLFLESIFNFLFFHVGFSNAFLVANLHIPFLSIL